MRASRADRLGPFLGRSVVGHVVAVVAVLTAGHLAIHPPRPLPPSVEVQFVKEGGGPPTAPPAAAVPKTAGPPSVAPPPPPKAATAPPPPPPPAAKVAPPPPLPPPPLPKPEPKPQVVHPAPKGPDHALVEKKVEEKSLADIRERLAARRAEAQREEEKSQRQEAARQRQQKAARQQAAEATRLERERQQLADTISRIKAEEQTRVAEARAGAEREQRVAAIRAAAASQAVVVAEGHRSTYQEGVGRAIKSNFTLPPNVPKESKLVTKMRVRVDLAGELLDVVLESPSGNQYFDDAVARAVKKSTPLQPPPDDLSLLDAFDGSAVTLYFEFRSDEL